MKYQLAQQSLAGARAQNQDRIATAERDNAVLMVLADGLGGHDGGELAAQTLVDTLIRAFQRVRQFLINNPPAFLALSIMLAHRTINARAKANNLGLSARTTCVACLVQNGYAYWAHVGDSRLYHFRAGQLLTRTLDHTTSEQLRRDGVMRDTGTRDRRARDYLLKCVGGPQRPRISLSEETRLMPGDVLFLCSDGVWEAFDTETIADYIKAGALEESVDELLLAAEARMKAACDNLSVIALRWEDAITTHPPLQPGQAMEIDQDILWREAKRRRRARAAERGSAAARRSPPTKDEIQAVIDELEAFVKRLEKGP